MMKTIEPKDRLKQGFRYLAKGIVNIFYALGVMIDASIRRWPYVYIICAVVIALLIRLVFIGSARAERDSLNKKNYELQQKLDTIQMINEAREEQKYVYHAN